MRSAGPKQKLPLDEFWIDEKYLTQHVVTETCHMYRGRTDLTPDELICLLKGRGSYTMTHTRDSEEFSVLREQLEAKGYIKVEPSWWNGDRVLKPFVLNGKVFEKHDKFPCAAAMLYDIQTAVKRVDNKIPK